MTVTRGCVRDNEPDCIDSLVVQAVVNQHEKKTRICACDWFIVFLAERLAHPRREWNLEFKQGAYRRWMERLVRLLLL